MRPASLIAVLLTLGSGLGLARGLLEGRSAWAFESASPSFRILSETEDELQYFYDGIPYPVRQFKKENCGFTERELGVIRDALHELPELYLDLPEEFRIEKKCELKAYAPKKRVRAAYTYPGKIVFSDQAFAVFKKDGKLYALNPEFSKKIVAHEFTHVLDRNFGLSSQRSFRQINQWTRNWALLLKPDKLKSEGFYRDQGAKNPEEDLATAAEGYFFDSSFICRQPAMYAWFSAKIGPTRAPRSDCSELPELNEPLDPRKIKAVGYMFISGTEDKLESRFGHALLHFHDLDGDPYNDILIQAAGNYPGQPVLTGQETAAELQAKQSQTISVSRLDFLFKGVTNRLDLVVSPVQYKSKWLETVIVEGRDIHEKILALTPEQLRAMIYIINRDVHRELGKYRFFKNNCATYVGETLNKVFATELIHKAWGRAYTPRGVWTDVDPVTIAEAPVVEGDRSRLARLLPKRSEHIRELQQSEAAGAFGAIEWGDIETVGESTAAVDRAIRQLDALVASLSDLSGAAALDPAVRKSAQSLLYTFTIERNLRLKGHALDLYQQVARMAVVDKVPANLVLP